MSHLDVKAKKENPGCQKSYGPFFLEYALMAEYNLLQKQSLPGVFVLPSARSPLLWFGVIFIRQGLYQGGAFKFCVLIPSTYPDCECPQILFDHPPFHPLIEQATGKLDCKRAFPAWKRNVNHIWNLLVYTRRVFYKIEHSAASNPEAAVLYENKLAAFKEKVLESIARNRSHIFDRPKTNDPHEIHFTAGEDDQHSERKATLFDKFQSMPRISGVKGLSWVTPNPPQTRFPFSKP